MHRLSPILCALLFGAVSLTAGGSDHGAAPAEPGTIVGTCAPVAGRDWLPNTGAILFGEYHGTREPAALFADLVCARLADADAPRLLVALEMPASLNPILADPDLGEPGALVARLREHPFWDAFNDGRSGASGLALAEWLLRERIRNPDRLHLLAFQVPSIDTAGATLIHDTMQAVAATQALVFTGNAHARKVPIPGKQPAALGQSLVAAGVPVVSLDIRHGGGTAWFCFPPCQSREVPPMPIKGARRIEREAHPGDGAFDGWYYVERLSLSGPARPPEP